MVRYFIYGAGNIGKRTAIVMSEKNIQVEGFIDTYVSGSVDVDGKEINIYKLEDVKNLNEANKSSTISENNDEKIIVIVAILDMKTRNDVKKVVIESGLECKSVEEVIYPELSPVEAKRLYVADFHLTQMDDYFENAENERSYEKYWGKSSIHRRLFDQMCMDRVLELGCGHGRHVPFYVDIAKKVVLVDILEKNIDYCKNRFSGKENIEYVVNNGRDFSAIEDNSVTAIFTYDSMVHFEMMDIYSYLQETHRILQSGGMALFEHSNNTDDYTIDFATGYSGRSYMSAQIFAYLAHRANLEVVEQRLIDSCGRKSLDCVTLVRKK